MKKIFRAVLIIIISICTLFTMSGCGNNIKTEVSQNGTESINKNNDENNISNNDISSKNEAKVFWLI